MASSLLHHALNSTDKILKDNVFRIILVQYILYYKLIDGIYKSVHNDNLFTFTRTLFGLYKINRMVWNLARNGAGVNVVLTIGCFPEIKSKL